MGTSFLYTHGSKLVLSERCEDRTLFGISGGDTGVSVLVQEDVMCDGKEPLKVWGGGAGAVTIMDFLPCNDMM